MNAIISKYYRTRSAWWRLNRILFPSPAELRLIDIMGGKVLTIGWLRHPKTKFKFAIVLSLGKFLKDEKYKREVRCGRYFIDFGNDVLRGIEVDGAEYHTDIVAAFDRDSYLYQRSWKVMHIMAVRLWSEPAVVQREVLQFLYT